MAPGGRIVVVEMIVGELRDPGPAALTDMNMLAAVPGQERSLTQYDALLSAAGLRRTTVPPTGSPLSVIEAVAASTALPQAEKFTRFRHKHIASKWQDAL
jgi:hypothetical protein